MNEREMKRASVRVAERYLADRSPVTSWSQVAQMERERLARRVVKLKGADLNLREVIEIMSSAPEQSGNELLFATDLLEKVAVEVTTYLDALRSLLNLRGPKSKFASPLCEDGSEARYDDGRDGYVCDSTGEVGPNGPAA